MYRKASKFLKGARDALPTARDVAEWMLEQTEQGKFSIRREDAARRVELEFGRHFVDEDENGRLVIRRSVLGAYSLLLGKPQRRPRGSRADRVAVALPHVLEMAKLDERAFERIRNINGERGVDQIFDSLLHFLDDVFRARVEEGPKVYPGRWKEDFPLILQALLRSGRVRGYAESYLEVERLRWLNTFNSLGRWEAKERERGLRQRRLL